MSTLARTSQRQLHDRICLASIQRIMRPSVTTVCQSRTVRFAVQAIRSNHTFSTSQATPQSPSHSPSPSAPSLPPSSTPPKSDPAADKTLTGRIRHLSRQYGWAAVAVYLVISLVDFGLCFAAVHQLGADRIGEYETALLDTIENWTGYHKETTEVENVMNDEVLSSTSSSSSSPQGTMVNTGGGPVHKRKAASLWTEAAIAYGLHKAVLIFVRVPVTVAITPPIVKALAKRGWKIGPKRIPKPLKQ